MTKKDIVGADEDQTVLPEATAEELRETLDGQDETELAQAREAVASEAAAAAEAAAAGDRPKSLVDLMNEGDALTPAGIENLNRLLNEVGARTAVGFTVDDNCRAFLAAEGAEITEGHLAFIRLDGIAVSSSWGLHRALLDWCMIATRRIMAASA